MQVQKNKLDNIKTVFVFYIILIFIITQMPINFIFSLDSKKHLLQLNTISFFTADS